MRMFCENMNNPYVINKDYAVNSKFTYHDFKIVEGDFLYENNITTDEHNDMYIYIMAIDAYFRDNHIGFVNRCIKKINMRKTYL